MNSTFRKVLCLLLTLVTLTGILSTAAFAENAQEIPAVDTHNVSQYDYYTVLGDSIASGYGMDAYFAALPAGVPIRDGNVVSGSYAQIVGSAVGATTVDLRSHSGWRTTDFLKELGLEAPGDEFDRYSQYYSQSFFRTALHFLSSSELNGEKQRIINGIEKADLITVNFGTNDLFSYALTVTVNKFDRILRDAGLSSVESIADLPEAFSKLLTAANEQQTKGIITEFVTAIETGLKMYEANFPAVIQAVRSINPEAKIVVVGLANPVNMKLDINSDNIGIDPYTLSDLLIDRANYFTRYTCPNANEYSYVDVVGTKFYGIKALDTSKLIPFDEDIKYSAVKMVHPDEAGHAYMANQLLSVLRSSSIQPAVSGSYTKLLKTSTLKWGKVDGAYRYYIYRSTDINGEYRFLGISTNETYYDVLAIIPGVTYFYKICAVMNASGTIRTPMSEPVALKVR